MPCNLSVTTFRGVLPPGDSLLRTLFHYPPCTTSYDANGEDIIPDNAQFHFLSMFPDIVNVDVIVISAKNGDLPQTEFSFHKMHSNNGLITFRDP